MIVTKQIILPHIAEINRTLENLKIKFIMMTNKEYNPLAIFNSFPISYGLEKVIDNLLVREFISTSFWKILPEGCTNSILRFRFNIFTHPVSFQNYIGLMRVY